jgi:hypothetical protein
MVYMGASVDHQSRQISGEYSAIWRYVASLD